MTQDEINEMLKAKEPNTVVNDEKPVKKSGFKSWFDGENDILYSSLRMKRAYEDHIKKEPTLKEPEIEEAKVRYDVYDIKRNTELKVFNWVYKVSAVLFCVALALALVFTVSYLPPVGDPGTPANSSIVSQRYIEQGLTETGAVNIVSGIILTYRAFDTFGETNVLFIATCCVMCMLLIDEKILKAHKDTDSKYETKRDDILMMTAKVLCPIIFIFGIYVILNGQLSPGGGFSGGAIMGAGMILFVSAFGFNKTQRFFDETVYKIAKITALCMYGLIGSYFYLTGANGINNHIPLGIPGHILSGGIILPIDIAVGIEVACTMYAFYALFRRGGL